MRGSTGGCVCLGRTSSPTLPVSPRQTSGPRSTSGRSRRPASSTSAGYAEKLLCLLDVCENGRRLHLPRPARPRAMPAADHPSTGQRLVGSPGVRVVGRPGGRTGSVLVRGCLGEQLQQGGPAAAAYDRVAERRLGPGGLAVLA